MAITGNVARGSIVWLNLNPRTGHEQAGSRPAIVLSDGIIPSAYQMAFIAPITTKPKGYPFEIPVPAGIPIQGLLIGNHDLTELSGVVLAEQSKSVDLAYRNATVVGQVNPASPFYQQVVTYVRAILA